MSDAPRPARRLDRAAGLARRTRPTRCRRRSSATGANGPLLVVADLPGRSPTTTSSPSRRPSGEQHRRAWTTSTAVVPIGVVRRPHGTGLPGHPGRWPVQRVDRGARPGPARPDPRPPTERRHPRRGRAAPAPTSTSPSKLADVLPTYLGAGRRAVAADPGAGVPLDPGAAHGDARVRAVAAGGLRRHHRDLPDGLALRPVRRPRAGTGAELPADHRDGHPLRPGDGLPAVPGLRDARGVRPRRAGAGRGRSTACTPGARWSRPRRSS